MTVNTAAVALPLVPVTIPAKSVGSLRTGTMSFCFCVLSPPYVPCHTLWSEWDWHRVEAQ